MRTLAGFLRSHREQILSEWERCTHTLPSARGLSRAARRDHIPQMLDAMADAIDRSDTSTVSLEELPLVHADERLAQDYDLREVVAEYRLLRRVVLDVYAAEAEDMSRESRDRLPPLITFNENIDHAITDALDHYTMQRDRTREYFVGMLSHDLRDPLNAISLGAQVLIRRQELAERDRHMLERILSSAERMSRLIADMLDVTRSRLGGGLQVSTARVDLGRIVSETIDELAGGNPERRIEWQPPADGDSLVGHWDPMRLSQLVSNLVANALKHGTGPIRVIAGNDGERVVLEVINGGGIPVELRAHVFEPFRTRDAAAGAGLGLYIASEITRAHGGELVLVPDTPGETRFRLMLPRHARATV